MEDWIPRRLQELQAQAEAMGLFEAGAAERRFTIIDGPDDGSTSPANENDGPDDGSTSPANENEPYSGGMKGTDAGRLLSCHFGGAHPRVHILASRKSIHKIASMFDKSFPWKEIDPVLPGKQLPSDKIEAIMKIPAILFDSVLGIDAYHKEPYSGGMKGTDAGRLLSCHFGGAHPRVHILASRKSIHKIASMFDKSFPWKEIDPVLPGKQLPSDQIEAIMKIPAILFDSVLGIDAYHKGPIKLSKDDSVVCAHEGPGQCFLICVNLMKKVYHFFGTEYYWRQLQAWKANCEGIQMVPRELKPKATTLADGVLSPGTNGDVSDPSASLGGRKEKSPTQLDGGVAPHAQDTPGTDSEKETAQSDDEGNREEVTYENGRYARHFEELDKIGEGAFGSVFKARRWIENKEYAVRKIQIAPGDHQDIPEMVREVQRLAKLSHAKNNIVAYKRAWAESSTDSSEGSITGTDLDEIDKTIPSLLYIPMELCDANLCEMLDSWTKKRADFYGEDTWKMRIFKILEQLLKAVDYLHGKRIIHKNIKPSNIFICGDVEAVKAGNFKDTLEVKLGDYGLATHRYKQELPPGQQPKNAGSSQTKVVNTMVYSAPELLKPTNCSSKVDIYSLGIVAAELLCLFETPEKRSTELERIQMGYLDSALLAYSTQDERKQCSVLTVFQMCNKNPDVRKTARELLDSGLFATDEAVIKGNHILIQGQDEQISLLMGSIFCMKQACRKKCA